MTDFKGESKAFLEGYKKFLESAYCAKVNIHKEYADVLKILHACGCPGNLISLIEFNMGDSFDQRFWRSSDQQFLIVREERYNFYMCGRSGSHLKT